MRRFAIVIGFVLAAAVAGIVPVDAGGGCLGWPVTQTGSSGPDSMVGDHGGDGPARRDVINGRGGNDAIYSGKKNDIICGRGGDDAIFAGDGGRDRAAGGAGTDSCDAEFQQQCES